MAYLQKGGLSHNSDIYKGSPEHENSRHLEITNTLAKTTLKNAVFCAISCFIKRYISCDI